MALPSTNGHSRLTCQPLRTRRAEINWPVQPPKTAMTAASAGSTPHTQIDIAAMAKAKPEIP